MVTPDQLTDMAAVHGFFVALLQEKLRFDIPLPQGVCDVVANEGAPSDCSDDLMRWLSMLDLAITPVMIRDSLQRESTGSETAEALLRYFHHKASGEEADRDKTDFIITFLFRHLNMSVRAGEQWGQEESSLFEQQVCRVLRITEPEPLPEQHRQLLREFPFVRLEVEDVRQFDQLMDSGVMQRVRDIKLRFGSSLYHPRVLAMIAEYNVFVGDRFDVLFREAARTIKQFAASLQESGSSSMSRVEGDVTVQDLAEVQEKQILEKEYRHAQEHLRSFSNFKKVVDRRKPANHVPRIAPPQTEATAIVRDGGGSAAEISSRLDSQAEDSKISGMVESIRNFVLAADVRSANIFPMRKGNIPLTPAEVDAFKAEYRGERSFRGDFAAALTQSVAIFARMLVETEDLRQLQSSAYLWKPYADSLTFLIQRANSLIQDSTAILAVAETRGLGDKVRALNVTLQKLRQQTIASVQLLETVGSSV